MQKSLRVAALLLALAAPRAYAQDQATNAAGAEVYQANCAVCHGERLVSPGGIPDLRRLRAEDRARFDATVADGKGQMPPWTGVLTDEEIGQIWAYIRSKADN